MIRALLVAVGLWPTFPPPQLARATTFDVPERDHWNPDGGLACYAGRPLRRTDMVVAHRTLPCRSRVLLWAPRTGRSVVAVVGDRGPYGRNRDGLDLAPATARALRANGWESVVAVPLP